MAGFVVRRVLGGIVILWLISVITFLLFFLVPQVLGSNPAVLFAGRSPSEAAVAGVTKKLGLDQPLVVQYWHFLAGIFVGRHFDSGPDKTWCPPPCFGYSFKNSEPVWQEITRALPVTVSLALGAAVLFLIIGVGIGIISALRRGSVLDRVAMTVALGAVSLPVYFTGLVLLLLVSYKWRLIQSIHYVPFLHNPLLWAWNLLPAWIVLAFLYSAMYARLTRASMLDVLGEDYIRTARAKGLPERTVVGKHALRAALTPVITIFGLDLGSLLGGAVLTESTFGFRGLGKTSIEAISTGDLPTILGVTIFAAFFVVFANIVVDLVYALVDPRVRPT
ncbi:ABC transporter permease [Frankia sp. AgB1.9]|uniref:ABC transporter permease n=1 Tax=unclassified Frankia TaxID=2632575 RepID=UPI0019326911|nr:MULTISPECIES: ABC transporter permease [unclassified Frankia]MBL7486522.1 ABC transporter permease [Frankia sp. AgW1.1]MBL7550753.1 ABC transporter permease [Frankia sp. AgB1.9]MBL7622585.1 ABC transporter permease [Frankia sp. AgB1.8]